MSRHSHSAEVVMAGKAMLCRLGSHAWVTAHPTDERAPGPDRVYVCRRCGRRRGSGPDGLHVFPGSPA